MDKDMIIKDKNIKGVKKTVYNYNRIPVKQRTSFNIWYDNITNEILLIQNDIFEQRKRSSETFIDETGFTYVRYDDISDLIQLVYPPYFGYKNISMSMLKSVLSQYVV